MNESKDPNKAGRVKDSTGKVNQAVVNPGGGPIKTNGRDDTKEVTNEGQTISEFIISECENTAAATSESGKSAGIDSTILQDSDVSPAHSFLLWWKRLIDYRNRPVLTGLMGFSIIVFVIVASNFFTADFKQSDTPATTPSNIKSDDTTSQIAKPARSHKVTDGRASNFDKTDQSEETGINQAGLTAAIGSDADGIEKNDISVETGPIPNDMSQYQGDEIEAQQINGLIASADRHLEELRLTIPQGQNALEVYQLVLSLDPDNWHAQRGIERIGDKYQSLAENMEQKGNSDKALEFLQLGRNVLPTSLAIRQEIDRVTDFVERRKKARKAVTLANQAIKQGDFEKAQSHLENAEKLLPSLAGIKLARNRIEKRKSEFAVLVTPRKKARGRKLENTKAGESFRDHFDDSGMGPVMVVISAGSFQMGDIKGSGDGDERPVHRVRIKNPFALGKYEVTFEEFDRFSDATGYRKPSDNGWGRGKRPVVNISWRDAKAYSDWLSEQTNKRYRLPSEAEWEYAARGGSDTEYWWGDQPSHDYANYGKDVCCDGEKMGKDLWLYTAPAGSFPANRFGLHEMAGNAWEWTGSIYQSIYQGAEINSQDTKSQFARVARGGAWNIVPKGVRSAYRSGFAPEFRNNAHGFRVARDLN